MVLIESGEDVRESVEFDIPGDCDEVDDGVGMDMDMVRNRKDSGVNMKAEIRGEMDAGEGAMGGFGEGLKPWLGYVTWPESGVRSSIKREADWGRELDGEGARSTKRSRERL